MTDEPDVIRKKFKTAVTDSGREVSHDPAEKPGHLQPDRDPRPSRQATRSPRSRRATTARATGRSRRTSARRSSVCSRRSRSATASCAPTMPSFGGCSRVGAEKAAAVAAPTLDADVRADGVRQVDVSRRSSSTSSRVSSRHSPTPSPSRSRPAYRLRWSLVDRVADRLAHPLHLALAALVEHQLDPRRARGGVPAPARVRPSSSSTPSRQRAQGRVGGLALHLDLVDLVDLVARVREPMREGAVVRQQDRARRVGVQAADGYDPDARVDEADDRRAAVRVARGRHDTGRLVQEHVRERLAQRPGRRRPRRRPRPSRTSRAARARRSHARGRP